MFKKILNLILFLLLLPSICFGAVVDGTNAGFVTVAPSADPVGTNFGIDTRCEATRFTSPAGNNVVSSMGWWCNDATEASNFEVGIYSHNAGDNRPNVLLVSNATNAKGTTSGWKTSVVSYTLSANTIYWFGLQLDDTLTITYMNIATNASYKMLYILGPTALVTTNWSYTDGGGGYISAIYALYAPVAGGVVSKKFSLDGSGFGKFIIHQ